jgi:hypothetical protein
MVLITPASNPNIDNLLEMYPSENTFYFEAGNYEITKQLTINRKNVRLLGLTGDPKDVHIQQKVIGKNGINIKADNVVINHISVHVEEGKGVCISHADANWTIVRNCNFYGSATNFTIYFAGPSMAPGEAR